MKVQDVSGNTIRLHQEMDNRSDVYAVAVKVGLPTGPQRLMMVIYHWQNDQDHWFTVMESVADCADRAECIEVFKNWVHADAVEDMDK